MIDEDHPKAVTILRADRRSDVPRRRSGLSGDGRNLMIAVLTTIVLLLLGLAVAGGCLAYRAIRWFELREAARETVDRSTSPARTASTNPADWISPDDYPPDALRYGDEGTVSIRWTVWNDGRVRSCTIVSSSGHDSLDRAACEAIVRNAQYPSVAADGPARTFTRRVVWKIPR